MRRTVSILPGGISLVVICAISLVYLDGHWRMAREMFLSRFVPFAKAHVTQDSQGLDGLLFNPNLIFTCQQQDCGFGMRTANKLLHKLRPAPPTIVDRRVEVKNGIASENSL